MGGFKPDVVLMWQEEEDDSTCPYCGTEYDYESEEQEFFYRGCVLHLSLLERCNTCGGRWYVTWELRHPKINPE